MDRDYIKYFFIVIIIIIAVAATIIFAVRKSNNSDKIIDQTSTNTNIKKNLRIGISNFDTINPLLSNNKNVQEISKVIFDSLIVLDGDMKLQYGLASEIGKVDNINYIIKLKDNVFWTDGNKLNANDVKFTIEALKNGINSVYSENVQNVESVEIIDDSTVKINLNGETPFFEYYLTFPILSSSYYAGENFVETEKNWMPVSTGMYKIETHEEGQIKLSKNENYWNTDKKAIIEEIDLIKFNSMGEVYNSFKLGEIDIIKCGVDNVEQYIGTIGYNKAEYKTRDYDFLSFNTQSELFSDKAVRKAISLGIDKSNLIASCFGTGYRESNFFFDYESWLFDNKLNVSMNQDLAVKTLEESGWVYKNNIWTKKVDGKVLTLRFNLEVNVADDAKVTAAENIANQLANIGIQVTVHRISSDNYINYLNNRSYDCILMGVRNGYSPNLETFFGNNNVANYYNEEVLQIINEVKNIGNQDEVKEKYQRLYDIYLDECPYIGIYRKTGIVVYNHSLVCNINPNAYNIFNNIEKWYRQ